MSFLYQFRKGQAIVEYAGAIIMAALIVGVALNVSFDWITQLYTRVWTIVTVQLGF